MIICNSKNFIFIHIPKCGGTSVSKVLEKRNLPQDVNLNLNPHDGWAKYLDAFRNRFGLFKHSTAKDISVAMTPTHFSEYYVFTFCRNPSSRAYSAFTFTKFADAKYRPESERYKKIKDMNFEQFLQTEYIQDKKILPAKPQSHWIEGAPVPVHVYKLEDVSEVLPALVRRLYNEDLSPNEVPRANPSSKVDEWKIMSDEAAEMVRTLYAEDFEKFGYRRDIASYRT